MRVQVYAVFVPLEEILVHLPELLILIILNAIEEMIPNIHNCQSFHASTQLQRGQFVQFLAMEFKNYVRAMKMSSVKDLVSL